MEENLLTMTYDQNLRYSNIEIASALSFMTSHCSLEWRRTGTASASLWVERPAAGAWRLGPDSRRWGQAGGRPGVGRDTFTRVSLLPTTMRRVFIHHDTSTHRCTHGAVKHHRANLKTSLYKTPSS
jgi:hypothetical protein